ncbi:META domain-containing protein [Leucobacter tenebrionis]|nr:META domain-containing protein [Leucobacter tenebrionis]
MRVLALSATALTGLLALSACAADPAPDATSVVGAWGEPGTRGEPSLIFEEDGSYSGDDGCNSLGGEWSAEGDSVDLGAMRSTLMYCEGVDTWLSQARTAELSGDTLTLLDEQGAEIGTLERAAE